MDTSLREVTTEATIQEKKKLRKELRLFDLIFTTIAAIVGIDTLGVISTNGAQSLTWLLISAVTFVIPYGLLSAELGSTFTQEGGVYEWCKLAGGRFYGSLASTLYWISNPLWLGGTLSVTMITAIKTFWFGNPSVRIGGSPVTDAICEILISLVFIWATTWCAIASLHVGKWLSVVGSYAKMTLLGIFVLLALVYLATGHASGAHFGLSDLNPFSNLGLVFSAILPALIFNWEGFELQNGAAEEMLEPRRDVPKAVIRGGLSAVLIYAIPIIAITFVLPISQISNASGFLQSFQIVATVLPKPVAIILGVLVGGGIILALASSGGTWIIGADRTYAIAALDRNAPSIIGRFSGRYGTPIVVNAMSGIVASVAMIAAIIITSFSTNPSVSSLFTLVLGFSISTATLAYLFIFPAYLILKYRYPNVKRVYEVPGGMIGAWIVTILSFIYAALACIFLMVPTDKTVVGAGVSRLTYELTQFAPLIVIILLTIVFSILGRREARNQDVVVALPVGDDVVEVTARSDDSPPDPAVSF